MTPCFFGSSERQLFGIHHPAQGAERATGVVLCYPAAQEYMLTHWAFRKLAGMLAREGFHVFRFDYYGTGDSAGEVHEGRVASWIQDIRLAVAELQDMTGVQRVALVGMRLGAALAVRAAAEGLSTAGLVLWEPLVEGAAYLKELELLQARRATRTLFPQLDSPLEVREELLGFAFPRALRDDILALDLAAMPAWPSTRTHLVAAGPKPEYQRLQMRLEASGLPFQNHLVQEEAGAGGGQESALLSNRVLQTITSLLKEAA
ncbi:alpha/beta fold hydrolase [Corallococcus praedator]|uniref:Alpha/beta fold hydrolase n=1 Tax=Corallococcus praedator TaxID=2316724 RepID=A0ABX9QHW6_9BACT|nr:MULTISPECIES: alpha/beta fold hydrolase [Corallococcus]RKH18696.1 alpha/beta fold hydrolase [Corallococcus sp. CA047B]RKH33763.1 alpha/beta fold hydrolase [Corallococcus sp. CA031C]RKI06346.1 alpha/beta fold hydrolase [Corallococcus praedator]